jgi:hypothetical protein
MLSIAANLKMRKRGMNRRTFLLTTGVIAGVASWNNFGVSAQQVELTPVPIEPGEAAATPSMSGATPTVEAGIYTGDVIDLWEQPWEIGSQTVEIGITIVQRFIGSEDQGYQLGLDGLVFRSVIYAKHDFQRMLFIGVDSDLSEIEDARTLIVTGRYGGVQHNTDSLWEDPILIADKLEVP